MTNYLYAIEAGTDVPLVNLVNVQGLIYPHNRVTSRDALKAVPIVSNSPDLAPIRIQTLDAQESRDGITYHSWDLILATGGITFWLNYLFSGAVSSITGDINTAVTIYTRFHELDTYKRYNCYAIYPTKQSDANSGGDLRYSHKRGLFYLHQRFNDLVLSS